MTDKLAPLEAGEEFDYRIDATGLLVEGETLVEAGSSIDVTGATKGSVVFEDDAVTVWLSDAQPGRPIYVNAKLKTSGGRTYLRRYIIPYAEPVSLQMARAQCSIDEDDDTFDILLTGYISAARSWVENHTGKIVMPRQMTEAHPGFCRFFDLRWGPFDADSIAIGYTDADGVVQTVSDATVNGSRVYPAFSTWWPSTRTNTGVTVSYSAGYANVADEAPGLFQAMLLLIAHWFSVRETASERAVTEVPFAAQALADQYRTPGL